MYALVFKKYDERNSFGDQIFEAEIVLVEAGKVCKKIDVINHEGQHQSFKHVLKEIKREAAPYLRRTGNKTKVIKISAE